MKRKTLLALLSAALIVFSTSCTQQYNKKSVEKSTAEQTTREQSTVESTAAEENATEMPTQADRGFFD